jgi:hypothetical protein
MAAQAPEAGSRDERLSSSTTDVSSNAMASQSLNKNGRTMRPAPTLGDAAHLAERQEVNRVELGEPSSCNPTAAATNQGDVPATVSWSPETSRRPPSLEHSSQSAPFIVSPRMLLVGSYSYVSVVIHKIYKIDVLSVTK